MVLHLCDKADGGPVSKKTIYEMYRLAPEHASNTGSYLLRPACRKVFKTEASIEFFSAKTPEEFNPPLKEFEKMLAHGHVTINSRVVYLYTSIV